MAGWLELLVLALSIPATAVRDWRARGMDIAADIEDLDEVEWQDAPATETATQSPQDWLFWSFFMFMAIAALPLIGIRWTSPDVASMECAFEDAILLALPVVVPLPFLFLGCLGALAFHRASRTPAAFAIFGFAMVIALAAMHAVLA